MNNETILVTSALPYANGPIHFGHIAGAYLPADVFVRFKKLLRADIVYICGTDEYGVAITIGAEKENRSPKEHVDIYHEVIKDIFKKFNISFDNFSRTTTERHKILTQKFFTELFNNGYIEDKNVDQFFCESCDRFLADRFVEGTCYLCNADNARGDECSSCGAWLDSLKLKSPKCKICGKTPIIKSTRHWFLKLGDFKEKLHAWLDSEKDWKQNVLNVAKSQIDILESRPITRDLKWGVPVPLEEAKDKVLYVWFDAPIGYVDSTMEWAELKGEPDKWKHYWQNPDCKVINFIGKDNIPFHLLVWPAMLMGQTTKYTLAQNVPANEFLNLEGKQFSKSEGWYVELDSFFDTYSADQIRYTLAASAPETKDSDFSWKDFQKYNNSDLVGVFGNLIYRTMTFTYKNFDGKIPESKELTSEMNDLLNAVSVKKKNIFEFYSTYQLKKAAYEIVDIARIANKFFDEHEPWKCIKIDKTYCGKILYTLFRLIEELSVIAYPIIPETSAKILNQLGIQKTNMEYGWEFTTMIADNGSHSITKPELLFRKIEDEEIEKEIEKLKASLTKKSKREVINYEPLEQEITYEDFCKLDFRVAKVLKAEILEKSKKLLKLVVDLGFEQRQIIAGIREHYSPEDMIGKNVIIVANLKPRKLMGEVSEGMVLAASLADKLSVLDVSNMHPGARVH